MRVQEQGIDISLEGISGCGKSYLLSQFRETFHDLPLTILEEGEDRERAGLDQDIVSLLRKSGDCFFRGGKPRTETFLLLALKMFDYEVHIAPSLAQGHLVLEDRSIDTIAIYQALVLSPSNPQRQLATANSLYQCASAWRQPPHLTFLLVDTFTTCLERAQQRAARVYSAEEIRLLQAAAALYERYAAQEHHRQRIIRLNRQEMDIDDIIHHMREAILNRQRRREYA